jgi:hypothetical protein
LEEMDRELMSGIAYYLLMRHLAGRTVTGVLYIGPLFQFSTMNIPSCYFSSIFNADKKFYKSLKEVNKRHIHSNLIEMNYFETCHA